MNGHRFEVERIFACWIRYTPLAAHVLSDPLVAIWNCYRHGLFRAINFRLAELGAFFEWADKASDIFFGEIRIEACNENRRAHYLGIAGSLVLEWIARR